jgi:hypothetical protein
VRRCIAESLGFLYETNILFRSELYRQYQEKSKTIKKMPDSEEYYNDALKLVTITKGGKQITKTSIEQGVQDFRNYIMNKSVTRKPDKELYDTKRFRYLAYLVIGISSLFNKTVPSSGDKKTPEKKNVDRSFSIDQYLDGLMSQPRNTYAVLSLSLPMLHCEGQMITQ